MVESLPTTQEMQVQSSGRDAPLEEGTAAHSSVLAWEIPWTEEPGGIQPQGRKEPDTTEHTSSPLSFTN